MRRFASIPYEFEPEIHLEGYEGYGADYDPLQYGYDPTLTQMMRRRSFEPDDAPVPADYSTPNPGDVPYIGPLPEDAGGGCGCSSAAPRVPWLWLAMAAGAGYIIGRR